MYARKPAVLLAACSAVTVLALFATPFAFADDDHGHGRGRGPGEQQVQQTAPRDRDDNNDRDDRVPTANAADARLEGLINAINNDVSRLTNLNSGDTDDLSFDDVRAISLSSIESNLSSSQASTLTNAVNANSGAVQTFLNGGSAQASAIDKALNAAGISPSSVLAVFPISDDRLIVLTS